jgi:signal transduction histidine kinase/CheY-like chemotaxis protein
MGQLINRSDLRLRTKFLLSLVLTTATLSCATLFIVRQAVKAHVRLEIVADTRNSLVSLQALIQQHQIALSRKADLMATLGAMSAADPGEFETSTDNPLGAEGTDLVALADPHGKITVFRTTNPSLRIAVAEEMLRHSLAAGRSADWWSSGGSVYQIALQPILTNRSGANVPSGFAVVGQEMNYRTVRDLGRISASEVAVTSGTDVAISTLAPLEEHELGRRLGDWTIPEPIQIGDDRYYAGSIVLTPGSQPAARLTVLKSYDQATIFLEQLNHTLLGLGIVAILAGAMLAFLISDTFTRPLASLVEGVRALERGDFAYPLAAQGRDEVAQVTRAFDRMRSTLQKGEAQKQHLEEQLRQSQKMEALGQLAGGVAHDFNNLLTIIKGHGELLSLSVGSNGRLSDSAQQIRKAADRAASLTRQMLAFSRRQVLQPTVLDLNVLVEDMSKLVKRLIHEDIAFAFQPGTSLGQVKADAGQMEQVLLNLIVNSCDAMPSGGTLLVETRNVDVDSDPARLLADVEPGSYVLLAVTDTGHGMDAATQARMFDPFFTTKGKDKGTGLGLATVYGVVRQSGGFIRVESTPSRGTRIEVYLPRMAERHRSEAKTADSKPATSARAGETVLLAEDETEVRALAAQFLTAAGYRVMTARDGAEALEIAQRLNEPIDLLVTDIVMPNMRGTELARRLRELLPELKVLYMSGYLGPVDGSADLLNGARLLQKPFSRDVLVHHANEALGEAVAAPTASTPATNASRPSALSSRNPSLN